MIKYIIILVMMGTFVFGETVFSEPKPSFDNQRKIIFSINDGSDDQINHVLSTANNVLKYYGPENVHMRIVAYYHGIRALLKVNKKIAVRVDALMQYDVEFVACGNSMRTKDIKKEELIDGTEIVTAGVVEVIERTKDGWVDIVP